MGGSFRAGLDVDAAPVRFASRVDPRSANTAAYRGGSLSRYIWSRSRPLRRWRSLEVLHCRHGRILSVTYSLRVYWSGTGPSRTIATVGVYISYCHLLAIPKLPSKLLNFPVTVGPSPEAWGILAKYAFCVAPRRASARRSGGPLLQAFSTTSAHSSSSSSRPSTDPYAPQGSWYVAHSFNCYNFRLQNRLLLIHGLCCRFSESYLMEFDTVPAYSSPRRGTHRSWRPRYAC